MFVASWRKYVVQHYANSTRVRLDYVLVNYLPNFLGYYAENACFKQCCGAGAGLPRQAICPGATKCPGAKCLPRPGAICPGAGALPRNSALACIDICFTMQRNLSSLWCNNGTVTSQTQVDSRKFVYIKTNDLKVFKSINQYHLFSIIKQLYMIWLPLGSFIQHCSSKFSLVWIK